MCNLRTTIICKQIANATTMKLAALCFVLVSALNSVSVFGSALPALGLQSSLYQFPGIGSRPLYVRNLHGIDGFQSDLFEVYMEPYGYDLRPMAAVAVLVGTDAEDSAQVKGELVFVQHHPPAGPVLIQGNITGLTEGKHGIHIHETGDMRNGCENIGEHFNPYHLQHGGPRDPLRHVGDIGNVEADSSGFANITIRDGLLSLAGGPRGVVGRAIAVTVSEDDLGRKGTADSVTNGSTGKIAACGIIAYIH